MAISAPGGWTDDEEQEVSTASFAISAPLDSSDDEVDSGAAVTGRPRSALSPAPGEYSGSRRKSAARSSHSASSYRLSSSSGKAVSALVPGLSSFPPLSSAPDWAGALQHLASFLSALQQIDDEEARDMDQIHSHTQHARDAWAGEQAQKERRAAHGRSQLTQRLNTSHHESAAAMNARVEAAQKAADERRAEEQRATQERARRQQQEEAQRQQQEAERAALQEQERARAAEQEAELRRQQKAVQQLQHEAAAAPPQQQGLQAAAQQSNEAAGGTLTERVTSAAAASAAACLATLHRLEAAALPLQSNEARKAEKRTVDKAITLHVNQISATEEQVNAKGEALSQLLRLGDEARRSHTLLRLADRLLTQCECQVALTHSFCFPLAEVTQHVMSHHADLAQCLLAKLHAAAPLSVPRSYRPKAAAGSHDSYFAAMGYRRAAPADDRQPAGAAASQAGWEATDAVASRMRGYILYLAALCQSSRGNPTGLLGIEAAWRWLASFLNSQPPNRLTAVSLDSFLRIAGFAMHQRFRGQFLKLLQCIDAAFLPKLAQSGDADARSVHARLHTYIHSSMWASVPEGRNLPKFDASSYDRA